MATAAAATGCGAQVAPSASTTPLAPPATTGAPSDAAGAVAAVEPAPGSGSELYPPNPSAIVVAIDPGHGGCLDWGVPDPSVRGVELAEKTLTLEIALRLRDRLEADGLSVVMTRSGDDALAGDQHPDLGCHGDEWRDVNGDGHVGLGADLPTGTRTRDELQARLDLVNLSGADLLVSIHINSPSEDGQSIEAAFSQTYYTDETPWAAATERLAEAVQSGIANRLDEVATYDRGDRGILAHNLYLVAPPLDEPTEERPNPLAQPARGALMPAVLAEVGSITVREEHDLLAAAVGQEAIAEGIFDGLAGYFAQRPLAARLALLDGTAGEPPPARSKSGPPYWAPVVDTSAVALRLTNTGAHPWPSELRLVAGWDVTDEPYLRAQPTDLTALGPTVPPLGPGESVVVRVALPEPPAGRAVAWISLSSGEILLSAEGSAPLQISTEGH